MQRCIGVKGESAHALLPQVKSQIVVDWNTAIAVFLERDVPEWTNAVCTAIPGADKLTPDCLGALVSLAYNRGASFNQPGDRYAEMRQIKAHVMARQLTAVAGDIRSMKRLWPNVPGLAQRREAEARLWEHGLDPKNASQPLPDRPHSPTEKPKPQIPGKSGGGAGTIIGGLIAAAVAVRQWGKDHPAVAVLGVVGIGCGIALWFVVRKAWAVPQLANQKDRP
jgi:GH24 family phage-related lysozyme (muramidase)